MIFIDDREGSADLAKLVDNGVLVRLEYGDAMFPGQGPEGEVEIGVERKTIRDLVNSIASGRLSAHQIPGMVEHYYRSYIVVEGLWRGRPGDGKLQMSYNGRTWKDIDTGRHGWTEAAVWHFLMTAEEKAGVVVRTTRDIRGTAAVVEMLESWWSKPWDEHKSHIHLHRVLDTAQLGRPSLLRRVAAELPGIGVDRSVAVERHFGSVAAMFAADVKEWMKVEGVGKVIARAVVEALHGQ